MEDRRKLVHRASADLDVTLILTHPEERLLVCVRDTRDGSYFEIPAEPYLALDVFDHPYIYRDFSTVDVDDCPLVGHR